jgi:hypothetical protein
MNPLLNDPEYVADVNNMNLSSRDISHKWGIGKSTVTDHREKLGVKRPTSTQTAGMSSRAQESFSEDSDGTRTVEAIRDRPVTLEDAREWIRASGDNPDDYNIAIRSIAYGQDMFSNRMSASPKFKKNSVKVDQVDYDKASKFIENFTYVPPKKDFLVDLAVLQPTDEQWGKTDFNGGSQQTLERIMKSYGGFAEYVKEYRPREVLFAKTGDGIENTCNTSSQRDTNDLDLPHQILAMFQADLAGIRMIAPLTEYLTVAHVPSNHGRWRVGQKADGGDSHADFGITNAKAIAHALQTLSNFDNVEIVLPEPHMESLAVSIGDMRIGLVHGHQSSGPDKMGEWWARQDHGRMPTWDADALFVGHWHSYRVYESGDGRPVFVGPASDNGSSWFSNLKGERATAGMLAVSFVGKKWKYQDIL